MAFLNHQDSKASIIKQNKDGGYEKFYGVSNKKRLIIKFHIPTPEAKTKTKKVPLKNNHQDSKPITKSSDYRVRFRK
ncbi:hypothetical protein CFP56_011443 [Quercus suber]|uniref:Uncharacterized protein n=1 Tax=Quercus suber TaxID=58331 RepID=A0AAW0M739_QUESU